MTILIRFNEWVLDRENISLVEIEIDPTDCSSKPEYDRKHNVIITLKDKRTLTLKCRNQFHAERELDFLTATIDPVPTGDGFQHYLVRAIHRRKEEIVDLTIAINKLMRQYVKSKKQEEKTNVK